MQQDQNLDQDNTNNPDKIYLSIKEDDLTQDNKPEEREYETALQLVEMTDQGATKSNETFFLESVSNKKLKNQPLPSLFNPRRPSDDLDIKYNLPGKSGSNKVSMIDQIEESFKLRKPKDQTLPPLPKKQLLLSLGLLLVGLIFLISATILALDTHNTRSGIALWTIGGICGLPGIFYAIKFCRAYYAKTCEERARALEEVPID